MSKLFLSSLLVFCLLSCGINKQAQQIKALEQCEYKMVGASEVQLAGTDLLKVMNGSQLDLSRIPSLALAMLRQNVPFSANLSVEIKNPSSSQAAIHHFDYILLINKQEVLNGAVNQEISIPPGSSSVVPLQINANVYQVLTNQQLMNDVMAFFNGASTGNEKKGLVTLKVKPGIRIGGNIVKYPGYITIDKEISSQILL